MLDLILKSHALKSHARVHSLASYLFLTVYMMLIIYSSIFQQMYIIGKHKKGDRLL